MDKVFRVQAQDSNGKFQLGPYFSISSARNQASRAKNKGATILSIDIAAVVWEEAIPGTAFH